jgi:hypothetical protein
MLTIQCPPLPDDTARAAELVFGRDHPYLRMGEALDALWAGLDLRALQSANAFLADTFYPYALATVLQYWEALSDQQMSQATNTRLDLKYAMHLPLSLPGIAPLKLCAFRQHVQMNRVGKDALQGIVRGLGKFANREKSSADVSQIFSAICLLSRAEIILECMAIALEAVAARDPSWLRAHAQPHWYRRYHQRPSPPKTPRNPRELEKLMEAAGNDGLYLLATIECGPGSDLAQLPEILMLRREWQRQFALEESPLKLRKLRCLFCGEDFNPSGIHPWASKEVAVDKDPRT